VPLEKKKRARYARPPGGSLTIILKATNACNMACTFCSVGPAGSDVMKWSDFERLATEVERVVEKWSLHALTFTFHGGEPTVLGAEWIDRACVRVRAMPVPVRFNMQSNLYKVTDDLVAVAREHDMKIGSSIDPIGGARVGMRGEDTWPRWKESYARLTGAGFHIGGIFVVTRAAADRARDVYAACEELNRYGEEPFGLQLNAVYPQGRAATARARASDDVNITPRSYGRFLVDMLEVWEERGRSVRVSPIQAHVDAFTSVGRARPSLVCTFRPSCAGTHVGVDYALDVAGCGRRLDSGGVFGNLHRAHLDELIVQSEEQLGIEHRLEGLLESECRACRFIGVCHGGCPDEASLTSGDYRSKSAWCEAYLALFDAIERRHGSVGRAFADPIDEAKAPELTVRVGHTHGDVAGLGPSERTERWIVPRAEGAQLDRDAELDRVFDEPTELLRLWVPNRQAHELSPWARLLADPRVVVVLYQAKGLAPALNLVNALGATTTLDVLSILDAEGGVEALRFALSRFVGDPLWKIQLGPFSGMLLHAIEGQRASLSNRFGLRPGSFGIVSPPERGWSPAPEIQSMVDALHLAQPDGPDFWPQSHAACTKCDRRDACGGQLAPGDGRPCAPGAKALVDEIHVFAEALGRGRASPESVAAGGAAGE
jgi:uncharacterized protein